MIKTLVRSIRQEQEKFRIPHSVQDVIPIKRIWTDGIFQTGNAYSRSYRCLLYTSQHASLYSGIPLWITPCSITERCMGISLL